MIVSQLDAEPTKIADRYGNAAKAGWSPVPDVLIFNQHKLGLSSEDMNVLLNLLAHYYKPGEMPFIRPTTIAKRMGVSTRSVQRSISRLRNRKLIEKSKGQNGHIAHDLRPLIQKLEPFARERIAERHARVAMRNGDSTSDA